jgi:uncharacterized protein (TIGR04168 family)
MNVAIIGDVHGFWTQEDTSYFNSSDYDCILFVGDLKGRTSSSLKNIFPFLQKIKKEVFFSYGNWDTSNIVQVLGEVLQSSLLIQLGSYRHKNRIDNFNKNLENFHLGMYQLQSFNDLDLIIGRPFSFGNQIAFVPTLKKIFQISNLEDSFLLYKKLIDQTSKQKLGFLTHNGPTGLGSNRDDIYGCDFKKEGGDWGDSDLEKAIEYAKSIGKKVIFAVSGHMHHTNNKSAFKRKWNTTKDGTLYINSAYVPRIKKTKTHNLHHHIRMELSTQSAPKFKEMWIKFKLSPSNA